MEIFIFFERSDSKSNKNQNTTLTPGRLEESEDLPGSRQSEGGGGIDRVSRKAFDLCVFGNVLTILNTDSLIKWMAGCGAQGCLHNARLSDVA